MSFTVYKSSAGSGKTFTLVKEYLTLVLKNPQKYSRVLAITFTNKAAAEMKERVLSTLNEIISAEQENELIEIYKASTGLSLDELKQQSGIVLTSILHNYSEFAICTIDSFVHRIVRTFAHDLRIPSGFEVELDQNILIKKAIDLLIEQLGHNELLTQILLDFAESRIADEDSWNIEHNLKELSKTLFREDNRYYIDYLRNMKMEELHSLTKKCLILNREIETFLTSEAAKILRLLEAKNINPAWFYQGNKGIYSYFKKIASGDFSACDAPSSYVISTIEDGKWTAGKATEYERLAIETVSLDMVTAFHEIQIYWAEESRDYYARDLLRKNMFSLSVLCEVERLIDEISRDNKTLHISEFGKRIAGIIADEPVPFIYERLGEKYQHFLIDEFQDTSVLQWQNLLPLIENSLSYDSFNMVVGDAKQAIYRFRSGEVEQFVELPKIYHKENNPVSDEREKILERNYIEKNLNTNYRSKREIIEFNNAFFECIKETFPKNLQQIYTNHKQEFNIHKTGGCIQIEFLPKEKSTDLYHENTLVKIEETVKQLLNDGFSLNDIAILCRRNSEGDEAARYLSQQGYPIISSDSLLLKNSPVVIFMLAVFRWICNPDDEIAVGSIARYLFQHKICKQSSFEDFLLHYKTDKNYLNTCLNQENIHIDIHELKFRNLYDMAEVLVRKFSLNANPDAYLQFFLDAVYDFMVKENGSLLDFLEWWNDNANTLSVQTPENLNAIHIMSIHKSKGLEFPAVIYPFADSSAVINSRDLHWFFWEDAKLTELPIALLPFQKTMEKTRYADSYYKESNKTLMDMVNLLYVAFTRPSERLYVFSQCKEAKEEPKSVPEMLTHYLKAKELFNPEQNIYTFGTAQPHQIREKKQDIKIKTLKQFHSSDWMQKLQISQTQTYNSLWMEEKKQKGNLIHLALSFIKTETDMALAVEKLIQKEWITEAERESFQNMLVQLIRHEKIKPFFESAGQSVKTEVEYLDEQGNVVRIDRLIFKPDETILIDFKTGNPEEKDLEQIHNYQRILNSLQYPNVKPYLIYLGEEPEIKELD